MPPKWSNATEMVKCGSRAERSPMGRASAAAEEKEEETKKKNGQVAAEDETVKTVKTA